MNKKRSTGVTIFGWLFILSGLLGILRVVIGRDFGVIGYGTLAYSLAIINYVILGCNLICGMFILKLESWSRKLAIILCFVSLLLLPFYVKLAMKYSFKKDIFSKQEQIIRQQYKPEFQKKALESLEKRKQRFDKAIPTFFVIFTGIPIIWNLFIIYFFTRARVKEQFEQEAGEASKAGLA